MENELADILEEMLKVQKSEDLLKKSFTIFKVSKGNRISRFVILLISIIQSFFVAHLNTVVLLSEIVSVVLEVTLTLFGVVFTGYAFFQALLSEEHLSLLIENVKVGEKTGKKSSVLYVTNSEFASMMMQFLLSIFSSVLLRITLSYMPENFGLLKVVEIDAVLAMLLICIYFFHLLVILWRLIGFLFNIYQFFNTYAVSRYISVVKKRKEKMEDIEKHLH